MNQHLIHAACKILLTTFISGCCKNADGVQAEESNTLS